MRSLIIFLFCVLDIIPMGKAYLQPRQQRDSALVGDQFGYGFELKKSDAGDGLGLVDMSKV